MNNTLRQWGRALLIVLLSSVMPSMGVPVAGPSKAMATPAPQSFAVDMSVFLCRQAQYSLGFTKTLMPVYESLQIPAARRTALLQAADKYAIDACGDDPVVGKKALRALYAESDKLVASFAQLANIQVGAAQNILSVLQNQLMHNALFCAGGKPDVVGNFMRGGTISTAITISGQVISGGTPGTISAMPLNKLGNCGGGGGGGGGRARSDFTLPATLDTKAFTSCMAHARPFAHNECPYANNPEGKDAEDAASGEAADERKANQVSLKKEADGSITLKADDGTTVTIRAEKNDKTDKWTAWGVEAFLVGVDVVTILAIEATAPAWVVVGLVAGAIAGILLLIHDANEIRDEPEYQLVPSKLCGVQIGDQTAWFTNPATGNPMRVGDFMTVCSCSAAVGSKPGRCASQAQRELERAAACTSNPLALIDSPVSCEERLMEANPWVSSAQAHRGTCVYKDCGFFATPNYSSAGCTCGGTANPGMRRPPVSSFWTDPSPVIVRPDMIWRFPTLPPGVILNPVIP